MSKRPSTRSVRVWVATFAVGSLLAAAWPAVAQEEGGGTVTAEVSIAEAVEACVLLSVATLDFGVLDFDDTAASDDYSVTSCSTAEQELFAAATDAATDPPAAVWALVDGDGPRDIDQFSLDADLDTIGTAWLATDPVPVGLLASMEVASASHALAMPPGGSAGAGLTLSFDITWTAIAALAEPTWTSQNSGTTATLSGVDFADNEHGWVVGGPGTILATADGGTSWQPQVGQTNVSYSAVAFASTTTGWAVGNSRYISGTSTGGSSWVDQEVDIGFQHGVAAVSPLQAWAVGATRILNGIGPFAPIYATDDGGATWIRQSFEFESGLLDVSFVDASHGWAVGADGIIVATDDGGQTWTQQNSGVSTTLHAVEFVDTNRGWTAGDSGVILHTGDGGTTWTAQDSGLFSTSTVRGLAFVSPNQGWAVGTNGWVATTVDGGTTWTPQETPTNMTLFAVSFVSPTRGWAVGGQGTIIAFG